MVTIVIKEKMPLISKVTIQFTDSGPVIDFKSTKFFHELLMCHGDAERDRLIELADSKDSQGLYDFLMEKFVPRYGFDSVFDVVSEPEQHAVYPVAANLQLM